MFKKACPEYLSEGSPILSVLSDIEEKAAAILTREGSSQSVSANAAKSGKSVPPKAAKGRPCLDKARERRWRPFDQTQDRLLPTFPLKKCCAGIGNGGIELIDDFAIVAQDFAFFGVDEL